MKIISKYKDYYDYLMGVYGEDPKIVLDRRLNCDMSYHYMRTHKELVRLYIGGYVIEGWYNGEDFYYGDNLKKVGELSKNSFNWFGQEIKKGVAVKIKQCGWRSKDVYLSTIILKDKDEINKKHDCPILIDFDHGGIHNYPILKNLKLASFIKAEDVHRMISDFISAQVTEKENIKNNQTDAEKILSKGLDLKRSFRPKMK